MKKNLALFLACAMSVALVGCGNSNQAAGTEAAAETTAAVTDEGSSLVYAVEAGSAGEAVAKEKGYQANAVASQADALMEVASGTSDAAIIDLLMAGAMIGEGTSYPHGGTDL